MRELLFVEIGLGAVAEPCVVADIEDRGNGLQCDMIVLCVCVSERWLG